MARILLFFCELVRIFFSETDLSLSADCANLAPAFSVPVAESIKVAIHSALVMLDKKVEALFSTKKYGNYEQFCFELFLQLHMNNNLVGEGKLRKEIHL